jgi:hypothetical protein
MHRVNRRRERSERTSSTLRRGLENNRDETNG